MILEKIFLQSFKSSAQNVVINNSGNNINNRNGDINSDNDNLININTNPNNNDIISLNTNHENNIETRPIKPESIDTVYF